MVAHPAGWHKVYFYPRPLRGGRPVSRRLPLRHKGISIHALCEEGDRPLLPLRTGLSDFYPRPLRGGRQTPRVRPTAFLPFLSTPSARRATLIAVCNTPDTEISIHALCEEGDGNNPVQQRFNIIISIHALCEEGDMVRRVSQEPLKNFYPRPLRGGRQQKQRQNLYFQTNYTTFCTNLEEP